MLFCILLHVLFQDLVSEPPAVIKDKRPAADWPSSGEIKFDKYKMRYRDNLPLALKSVGFTVKAKEKIGIVGRSGSGGQIFKLFYIVFFLTCLL